MPELNTRGFEKRFYVRLGVSNIFESKKANETHGATDQNGDQREARNYFRFMLISKPFGRMILY